MGMAIRACGMARAACCGSAGVCTVTCGRGCPGPSLGGQLVDREGSGGHAGKMGAIEVYEKACLRAFYVVASGSLLSTARNVTCMYLGRGE